jgi:Arc/MetJ family transcription regulator
MKTTLILNDDLIKQAMQIHGVKTKTGAIERALQDAIDADNRRKLANLYGKRKGIQKVNRR